MCPALYSLYSSFPPLIACEHQNNTEDKARKSQYPHFTSRGVEIQDNLTSKGRNHDSNQGGPDSRLNLELFTQ